MMSYYKIQRCILLVVILVLCLSSICYSDYYSRLWSDVVIDSYQNTSGCTGCAGYGDPCEALGRWETGDAGYALGNTGGYIILGFTDNLIYADGTSFTDLEIASVPFTEDDFAYSVYLRPYGSSNYIYIDDYYGPEEGRNTIDIDEASGLGDNVFFDAVKIVSKGDLDQCGPVIYEVSGNRYMPVNCETVDIHLNEMNLWDVIVQNSYSNIEVYKNENVVYSINKDCDKKIKKGETVKGKVEFIGTADCVKIKLNKEYNQSAARLYINDELFNDETEILCLEDQSFVDFKIEAFQGETEIDFTVDFWTYGSEDIYKSTETVKIEVKPNSGNACCSDDSSPVTACLEAGNIEACVGKYRECWIHNNGDIEVLLPGYKESYIMYPNKPGFLHDWDVEKQGNTVILTKDGKKYNFNSGSPYRITSIADMNYVNIVEFSYDQYRRPFKQWDSQNVNRYIQYAYNGTGSAEQPTQLTLYGAGDSRQYNISYDPNTGNISSMTSGCGSCGLSGSKYTYYDNGLVHYKLTDSDEIVYEYIYDSNNRLTQKWLGDNSNGSMIQLIDYNDVNNGKIVDTYDYMDENSSYWRTTREYWDTSGAVVKKLRYKSLNITPDMPTGDIFVEHFLYVNDPNTGLLQKEIIIPATGDYNDLDPNAVVSGIRRELIYDPNTGRIKEERMYNENDAYIILNQYEYYGNLDNSNVPILTKKEFDSRGAIIEYLYDDVNDSSFLSPKSKIMPEVNVPTVGCLQLRYNYEYDSRGRVIKEKKVDDSNDAVLFTTNYKYDNYGNLQYIYYNNDLSKIETEYRYNAFSDLVRDISASGVVSGKSYNNIGQLESEYVLADANDINQASPDLISQTLYKYDGMGRIEYIAKADDQQVFSFENPCQWIWTKYEYDIEGNKTKVIEDVNGIALATEYVYNFQGEIEKVIHPSGKWTKTVRDGRGLTEKTVVGYTFSSTDIDVLTTEYYYDENGNVTTQINPDHTQELYYYDDFDRIYIQQQQSVSGPYTFYDANIYSGDIERKFFVDSNGIMLADMQKDYDSLGRVWCERVLFEPNLPSDVNDRITIYEYDILGNLSKTIYKGIGGDNPNIVESNDIIVQNLYDDKGQIVYLIDGQGYSTQYTYYQNGDVNEIIDPNGNITKHYYDNAGRLCSVVNSEGHYSIRHYNSLNQLYKEIFYDCNESPTNTNDDFALEQIRYEYDNLGNLETKITMKNPASTANSDISVDMYEVYDYNDTTGLLDAQYHYTNSSTTPLTTTYYYDEIERIYRTVDPVGNEEIKYFDYSNNAQIVRTDRIEYDPYQLEQYAIITYYDYDSYGRLFNQTIDDNNSIDFDDLITTYYYDDLSRTVSIISPAEVETYFEYDGFGNIKRKIEDLNSISEPNNLNRITDYGFDRLGRQSWIKGYDGIDGNGQITNYQYNKNNQITKIIYPDSNGIEYIYNDLDKVQREINRDGSNVYYGYDSLGNRIWESDDPNGNENAANFLCEYEFDGKNRLIYCGKFDNGAIMAASEFEYNGFGLTSREATALYDLNDVEILYDYDQSGNIKSRTLGNEVFEYTYDGLRRIASIKRNDVNVVDYAYIGRNTKSITYDEAYTTEAREYDQIGRLNRIYSLKDGDSNTILDLQYLYDDASNRTSVKYNHLSSPVWDKYGYDRLSRLTSVDYGSSTAPSAWIKMQGDIYLAYQAGLIWLFDTDLTDYKDILVSYKQSLEEQKTAKIKEKYEYISKFSDIALDKDFPVLTLSVMSDNTAKKDDTTTEMLYDENNNLIGKVVSGSDGNITEFTLFLDDGTYVVIDTEYSKTGEITSNLFNTYDANDNMVSSVDMLLEEQSFLASSSSESISTPVTESMSMSMMSIPVSSFGEASAPYESGESFEYDLLGNRITHDSRSTTIETYYTNNFNQYSRINNDYGWNFTQDVNISWDNKGNLQSNDFTDLAYTYDYRNRLTKVEGSSSTFAEYDFDALGRRIRKLVDGTATVFYYDTMGRVIAEYKGEDSNSIVLDRSYLHGNGYNEILGMFLPDPYSYIDSNDVDWLVGFSDEWLCQSNCSYDEDSDGDVDFVDFAKHLDEDGWHTVFPASNTHYYYLKDALGSVACVIEGQSNNPEDREFYLYDAYGKPADSSNESASGNPYGFAGMRYDGEIGLYHTLYRAYDPDLGRWMEVDPLEYVDSLNLYEYVKSNPIMYIDPLGMGVLKTRIDRIEKYIKMNLNELAAEEASLMYEFLAHNPNGLFPYPLANEFLSKWINDKSGNYNLSESQSQKILKETKKCIAYRLSQQKSLCSKGEANLNKITAKSGTDYFYALGWFKVSFSGKISCCHKNKVELDGTFVITDKYDWADSDGKYVKIAGDIIKDSYASLVEQYGYAKPFYVFGEIKRLETYDTSNTSESDCDPAGKR